jgi:hypothetical protein
MPHSFEFRMFPGMRVDLAGELGFHDTQEKGADGLT